MNPILNKINRSIYYAYLIKEDCMESPLPYMFNDKRDLIYLINYKVACSSIKAALVNPDIADDNTIHVYVDDAGYIRHQLTEDEKRLFKFTFVRNPFDRLVSCYESKYHNDREKYGIERTVFDIYADGLLKEDRGFGHFIDQIVQIPYRRMDGHFWLQHMLIYSRSGRSRVDYIGRYEHLAEDFEPIRQRFGLPALPHLNDSGNRDWRDYYTEDTARKVWRKYRKDFAAFGYEDSYRDLIEYIRKKT